MDGHPWTAIRGRPSVDDQKRLSNGRPEAAIRERPAEAIQWTTIRGRSEEAIQWTTRSGHPMDGHRLTTGRGHPWTTGFAHLDLQRVSCEKIWLPFPRELGPPPLTIQPSTLLRTWFVRPIKTVPSDLEMLECPRSSLSSSFRTPGPPTGVLRKINGALEFGSFFSREPSPLSLTVQPTFSWLTWTSDQSELTPLI